MISAIVRTGPRSASPVASDLSPTLRLDGGPTNPTLFYRMGSAARLIALWLSSRLSLDEDNQEKGQVDNDEAARSML